LVNFGLLGAIAPASFCNSGRWVFWVQSFAMVHPSWPWYACHLATAHLAIVHLAVLHLQRIRLGTAREAQD
jgi:hypothetical protein